jgi:hypothetical protein
MSFYTPYSGSAVDLSADGTANCYIVPLAYSTYTFDCTVKGNSMISVGSPAEAVVLWETRNDTNPINVGDVIESITLEGDKVKFLLPFEPKPGNALVAVKDANGTILWSWHIWVVDFDPTETQSTLSTGAVIMDRNLGALSTAPGSVESFGFFYQWGRKDPFIAPNDMHTVPEDAIKYEYYDLNNDTIENSVKYPHIVYNDAQWNYADDLWGITKTKYDPCPHGWKVPVGKALSQLTRADTDAHSDYYELSPTAATPVLNMPLVGYTDGSTTNYAPNQSGHFWTASRGSYVKIHWCNDNSMESSNSVDYLQSVRCMKDE